MSKLEHQQPLVCFEWAGSGKALNVCLSAKQYQAIFVNLPEQAPEQAPDQAWMRNHMNRVRNLQVTLVKHMLKCKHEKFAQVTKDCRYRYSSIRVFAEHQGPELTLHPRAGLHYKGMRVPSSVQPRPDHFQAWKTITDDVQKHMHASNTTPKTSAGSPSLPSPPSQTTTSIVLSVSWYRDVDCAMAHVFHEPDAYAKLPKHLQQDKEVIMSFIRTHPIHFRLVVNVCPSSMFRADRDMLLAGSGYRAVLDFAEPGLRRDKAFVALLVSRNPQTIEYADQSVLSDVAFISQFINTLPERTIRGLLSRAPGLAKDKVFVLQVLKLWPDLFLQVDNELKTDLDVVSLVLKGSSSMINYIPNIVTSPSMICKAAQIMPSSFQYIIPDLDKVTLRMVLHQLLTYTNDMTQDEVKACIIEQVLALICSEHNMNQHLESDEEQADKAEEEEETHEAHPDNSSNSSTSNQSTKPRRVRESPSSIVSLHEAGQNADQAGEESDSENSLLGISASDDSDEDSLNLDNSRYGMFNVYDACTSLEAIKMFRFQELPGAVEVMRPDVHHHELILTSSSNRECDLCRAVFAGSQHYRCAVWCAFDACVTCFDSKGKQAV